MFKRSFFLIILFIEFVIPGFGQSPLKDFQTWQNFEVEYQINKRWLSNVQVQTRFTENATQFSYYYVDAGLMYRITKNLRFNVDYVLVEKRRPDESFSTRNQYNIHLNFRKKIGQFTIFDRLLTEGQFTDYLTSRNGKELGDFYVRNKLSARYRLFPKLSIYLSDEIYYHIDGKYYETGFNRNRLSGGLLYKLTDLWLLESYYTFEDNFKAYPINQNFILGFGLTRSFYQ